MRTTVMFKAISKQQRINQTDGKQELKTEGRIT